MAIKGWTLSLAFRKNNDKTKRILSYAGECEASLCLKNTGLLGGSARNFREALHPNTNRKEKV